MDFTAGYVTMPPKKKPPKSKEFPSGYVEIPRKAQNKETANPSKLDLDLRDKVKFILQTIDEHMTRMRMVLEEFEKEFPAIKGKTGFILHGHRCSKKNCKYCPHSLEWRKYDYRDKDPSGEYIHKWVVYEGNGLPLLFWQTRSPRVGERFRYYEEQRAILTSQRTKVTSLVKKLEGAYMSAERAKVFKQ